MAEPEEQQAEDHEGRQGGNHQDRPHDPGPQDRRQVALDGGLRRADRTQRDRWPSGLRHTLGKRAWCQYPAGFQFLV